MKNMTKEEQLDWLIEWYYTQLLVGGDTRLSTANTSMKEAFTLETGVLLDDEEWALNVTKLTKAIDRYRQIAFYL